MTPNPLFITMIILLAGDGIWILFHNPGRRPLLWDFALLLFLTAAEFVLMLCLPGRQEVLEAMMSLVLGAEFYFLAGFFLQHSDGKSLRLYRIGTCLVALGIAVVAFAGLEQVWALLYLVQLGLAVGLLLLLVFRDWLRVKIVLKAFGKTLAGSAMIVCGFYGVYLWLYHDVPGGLEATGSCLLAGLFFLSMHQMLAQTRAVRQQLDTIQREEALRAEFADYLHDFVLQDVLSVRNLLALPENAEARQLAKDTLASLSGRIRQEMARQQIPLPEGKNFRQNLQAVVDTACCDKIKSDIQCDARLNLPAPYDKIMLRAVRELCVNASKYANANIIWISLTLEKDRIILVVADNGQGGAKMLPGHGLCGLKDRAERLGGEMHIENQAGTTITICLPVEGGKVRENFIR